MGPGYPEGLRTAGRARTWIRGLALLLVGAFVLVLLFSALDKIAVSPSDPLTSSPASQAEHEISRAAEVIPVADDQSQSMPDSARRSSAQAQDASPVIRRAEPGAAPPSDPPERHVSETAHPENPVASDDADHTGEDGWSIAGTVFDDAGTPLPGVTVHSPESRQTTVTDALGLFRIDQLEPGEHVLSVDESEHHHGTQRSVLAGAQSADLHLQRKGSIAIYGQITDGKGQPITNALVRVLGTREQRRSDGAGAYEIKAELVRAGAQPILDFAHPEHRDARKRVTTHSADLFAPVRVDVVMEAEQEKVPVMGWVTGPHGESVAAARVNLSSPQLGAFHSTVSDEQGEFSFQDIEIGPDYRVRVEPPSERYRRYVSDFFAVGPDGMVHEAVLQASDEAELSGLIVDLEGRALPDLTFWLRNTQVSAHRAIAIHPDRQGYFEPVHVPAGNIHLGTRSMPAFSASGILLSAGETREVLIPVDWGQEWLFGRVVDPAGEPVPRATVIAQWQQQFPDVRSTSRRQTQTDLGGYFNFANLGAPSYQLTVQAQGFTTSRTEVSPQAHDEVTVQLRHQDRPSDP